MTVLRKPVVVFILAVFLIYWANERPNSLADTTKALADEGWYLATLLFDGIINFIGALT